MIILDVNELAPGMLIAEPIYNDATGELLLARGTKLTTILIESIKRRNINYIPVTERYTLDVEPTDAILKELKEKMKNEITRLAPERVEANISDNMVEVSKLACKIADQLLQDENLLKICLEMKINSNDLLYKHCVGTCVLSLLVAGAMGLPDYEIYEIGAGALIHDIGMREMPFLINKENMNASEESLWKEHTTYGYYIAKELGFPESIAKLILCHHERWNGSGFPNRLHGGRIPLGSRIISVCETYNRLITYKNLPEYEAIEYLYGSGNYVFDANVVNAFTNSLAVYPIGSIVRLTTGEVGIVVNVRQNIGPRPIIALHYNKMNRRFSKTKYIDLAQEKTVFIKEVLRFE